MTDPKRERDEAAGADAAWIERVADVYRPRQQTAAERAAFTARLDARIAQAPRRRLRSLAMAGATLAAAALALWVMPLERGPSQTPTLAQTPQPAPEELAPEAAGPRKQEPQALARAPQPEVVTREPELRSAPEPALLTAPQVVAQAPATDAVAPEAAPTPEEAFLALVDGESDLDESLPDDFAAIESLLLGG